MENTTIDNASWLENILISINSSDLYQDILSTDLLHRLFQCIVHDARLKILNSIDVEELAMLERKFEMSIQRAEYLDVFELGRVSAEPRQGSAKKSRRSSTSLSPENRAKRQRFESTSDEKIEEVGREGEEIKNGTESLPEEDTDLKILARVSSKLDQVLNGVEAAICAFFLMTSERLSKQLYPEDLIIASLNLMKSQLEGIVYPLFESYPGVGRSEDNTSNTSIMLKALANPQLAHYIAQLTQLLTILLQKVYDLMHLEELSDRVIISIGFIAIGPFFIDDSTCENGFLKEQKTLEHLKLVALGLLRSIFIRYPEQRTWILEEIMCSLIKLPKVKRNLRKYTLPEGKSIQMVSALILQLVQSCTEGIMRTSLSQTRKSFSTLNADEEGDKAGAEHLLPEHAEKYDQLWKSGLEAATSCARYVFQFFLTRCSKSSKSMNETEYRALLDNFIEDVITVLNYPEFPAAELFLNIFGKIMVNYIDDKKIDNTSKGMALDYLGTICSRIKKFDFTGPPKEPGASPHPSAVNPSNATPLAWLGEAYDIPMGEMTVSSNHTKVKNLWECQNIVLDFLEFAVSQDSALNSARFFLLCEWGHQYVNAWKYLGESKENEEVTVESREIKRMVEGGLQALWRRSSYHVSFNPLEATRPKFERPKVVTVAELLAARQALFQSFDSMLSRILVCLESSVINFRTKALRALGQVVMSMPALLNQASVRQAIGKRFQDSSAAVRDAAIELVGRYLSQRRELTLHFYKILSERILDTGPSVRKRVIKLLRDIYIKIEDQNMMVDIACKLLPRINDEDIHVKELALRTFQEIWFSRFSPSSLVEFGAERRDIDYTEMTDERKEEVLERCMAIVGVAASLGQSSSELLSTLIRRVLANTDGRQRDIFFHVCQCIVDCMIDQLVGVDSIAEIEDPNTKSIVINCIHTLYLFCKACPRLLCYPKNHYKSLGAFLKRSKEPEEQKAVLCILKIYQQVLGSITKPDSQFFKRIEQALIQLLNDGPQTILLAAVHCLCIVADKLLRDYSRLINIFRYCIEQLEKEKQALVDGEYIKSLRIVMRTLLIVSSIFQHLDLDKLRDENPDQFLPMDTIHKGPLLPKLFDIIISFASANIHETVKAIAIQSLSFLFQSHPTLMLEDPSRELMNRVFEKESTELKIQLLKVYNEYLVSEMRKADPEKKESKEDSWTDLSVLMGDADQMVEAGVSTSIMQLYLDQILACVSSPDAKLKAAAFDVMSQVVQQGLAHPILCVPTITALETSPEAYFREQAFRLHSHLNSKYGAVIHVRNVECVKAAYAYQKQVRDPHPVLGYILRNGSAEALLNPIYSLFKDKRQRRNEFLSTLIKIFDIDVKRCKESNIDADFCRFVAENLASLDYKVHEEVLHVIHGVTRVISVTGITVLQAINQRCIYAGPAMLPERAEAHGGSQGSDGPAIAEASQVSANVGVPPEIKGLRVEGRENEPVLSIVAKVSVCITMLVYLREHLKALYGLNEAKCEQFSSATSSTFKDKPIARQSNTSAVVSWDRAPYVTRPLAGTSDMVQQCFLFRELMATFI
ncbi:uncharacterized protein VTP21DRAFT_10395 [Calcarisporiella thermophila]|uniref:uncharacterized protein n=1 Tax=Calcarisporiella thermophila TaxID=911321 RepID=UPI003743648C